MKTLVSIKKDLEFNKSLSSLLQVLKTIAVSQYKALEKKISSYEKFTSALSAFFEFIDINNIDHIFLKPQDKRQIVIAITSDSGLLGGLNMQVIGMALRALEEIPGRLIVVGERGKTYAGEMGVPFTAFGGIREEERASQALQLRDYVVNKLIEEGTGYLRVVYPRPVSFTVQRVEAVQFLPYTVPDERDLHRTGAHADIIMESDPADIIEYLVRLWIGRRLYDIFGLSRLAEFAARFIHLEESAHKLKEMDQKLQLQYFRVGHELIDRNMRELFSARLLYATKH
jgi:ATP synthase F1 gamma subunit